MAQVVECEALSLIPSITKYIVKKKVGRSEWEDRRVIEDMNMIKVHYMHG
jgi:hypothetical protein